MTNTHDNAPIGVPSGWEEIAAMMAAPPFMGWDVSDRWDDDESTSSDFYLSGPHDWTVLE